jgi:FkbM family methyltransferase
MKSFFLNFTSFAARILPPEVKKQVYRLGPASGWIRRFLTAIAPVGLTEVKISSGRMQGLRMVLDMQSEKDYWLGTYEIDLQAVLGEMIQTGWIAYDVGANIGFFSLLLATLVGENGRVFAFESLPGNVNRLKGNLAVNDLSSQVTVVQAAVIDHTGPVKFLLGPSGAMGKVLGSAGRVDIHAQVIEVTGISLDDFVYHQENPAPNVIKMDIEGGEVLALEGMIRLLVEARPLLFLELHGEEAAKTTWDILVKAGYELRKLESGLPVVESFTELAWKAYLVGTP